MPQPIPSPRESGFTTRTPTPLYWARYGPSAESGTQQLVVLHGGPGAHHDYMLPQMLHLAERYDVVFYDQRGGGRSKSDTIEPIGWQTHVADLAAVGREFGLDPLAIVGYSWGGLLAVLYTLESLRDQSITAPSRLVLIDPAPLALRYRKAFEAEFSKRQQSPEVQRMRAELAESNLRETDPGAYRQRLFEVGVAGYFAHPANARDLTPFRVTGRVLDSVWNSLGDYDLLGQLNQITCPTLVVHGRDDPIPLASSIEGAKAMNAKLVVLDDCGHVPYVEKPQQLFAAVDAFLAETDPK
ncbi:MAG: alpha/beta hydrolase [Gemmatimonadota bacterium]|nr:alpha/beta hydrolase [Gemmatimonadota bacterium]